MSLKKFYINGANKYKVTFELPINDQNKKKEIKVVGDFNDWNWSTAKAMEVSHGRYTIDLELDPGKRYEYRYLVNNEYWVNDDIADEYNPSPCDNVNNCVLILYDPNHQTATDSEVLRSRVVDFTKIEGISLDIKILLNNAGIKTYRQLGDTSVDTLSSILSENDLQSQQDLLHNWIDRADQLDQDDW